MKRLLWILLLISGYCFSVKMNVEQYRNYKEEKKQYDCEMQGVKARLEAIYEQYYQLPLVDSDEKMFAFESDEAGLLVRAWLMVKTSRDLQRDVVWEHHSVVEYDPHLKDML